MVRPADNSIMGESARGVISKHSQQATVVGGCCDGFTVERNGRGFASKGIVEVTCSQMERRKRRGRRCFILLLGAEVYLS